MDYDDSEIDWMDPEAFHDRRLFIHAHPGSGKTNLFLLHYLMALQAEGDADGVQ